MRYCFLLRQTPETATPVTANPVTTGERVPRASHMPVTTDDEKKRAPSVLQVDQLLLRDVPLLHIFDPLLHFVKDALLGIGIG